MSTDQLPWQENKEFKEWFESLPTKSWARYDLSACRLGWEAAMRYRDDLEKGHD